MNHEDIKLKNLSKIFEFEKISRSIEKVTKFDNFDDFEEPFTNDLKKIAKYFVKLWFLQQETLESVPITPTMNPDTIELTNISKNFHFEKVSRDIDTLLNIDVLINFCKYFMKLYLLQQETLESIPGAFQIKMDT
jgi:hypothetical protein